MSRWGTYYGKTYKKFRKDFETMIAEFRKGFRPLLKTLTVHIQFFMPYPKDRKGMKPWPKGDIDNYLKAVWDSCNEFVWRDDCQIMHVEASKQYDEKPRIVMSVEEHEEPDPNDP